MQNAQIAFHIKSLCKERKITVKKLLSDCGIRNSLISDMVSRDWTPSVKIIINIAEYFGVSIDYLVGRTENPEVNK